MDRLYNWVDTRRNIFLLYVGALPRQFLESGIWELSQGRLVGERLELSHSFGKSSERQDFFHQTSMRMKISKTSQYELSDMS